MTISMNESQNNTPSLQAVYHIAKNFSVAHSEGVDEPPLTLFTLPLVEISLH